MSREKVKSSRGGLEVERLLHKLHDSISVGSNPKKISVVIQIVREALSLKMFKISGML